MFCSLPPLIPSDPSELWYTPLVAPSHDPPSSSSTITTSASQQQQQQLQQNQQQNQQQNNNGNHTSSSSRNHRRIHGGPARTQLTELRHDEQAIGARKGNIRRFGAGWLKPPGLPKTLQGLWDEKLEREEAEAAAQREAALAEAQAAQEELEREARRAQLEAEGAGADGMGAAAAVAGAGGSAGGAAGRASGEDGEEGAGGPVERNLDDDIPNADDGDEEEQDGEWVSDDDDDDDDDEDAFGDTGVEGEGDYAENIDVLPPGMDADLDMMGDGRDLDDDVPEAGSYGRTDSDELDIDEDYDAVVVDDETRVSMSVPSMAQASTNSAILGGSSNVFNSSSPATRSHNPQRSSGYPGRQ